MTILVKKVFISSKPTFVCLLCPPLCGPFSIQESAAGGLSYKENNRKIEIFRYIRSRGRGARTPIYGFGDRCSTIELFPYILLLIT